MALQKVEIDKDKKLLPGDIIEMHFKTTGMAYIQAAQIALIEWRLAGRKDFQIVRNSLPENNRVIFTIEIVKPEDEKPELQTAGISGTMIAAAICAVAVFGIFYLTLEKIYQIMESPEGKIAVAGSGIGLAALGIAALLYLMPRK
jgi:hypothetical protein